MKPSTKASMTLERFLELAAAYGGNLKRWPEDDRAAAQRLASESGIARAALAEAEALDAVLDRSYVPAPSPALRQAILTAGPRPQRSIAPVATARLRRWLSGLGAVGVLSCGAAAGAAVVALAGQSHLDSDAISALYDQTGALDNAGA